MYTLQISWKKVLEIVIAVLTALLGTIGVVSCIGSLPQY